MGPEGVVRALEWCVSVCLQVWERCVATQVCELCPLLQVEVVLDSFIGTFGEVEMAHKKPGSVYPWQPVYRRYMEVLKKCILQIYHD